jgi:hypothetical protein
MDHIPRTPLDFQHHQHMPLPSMYQYHQHTITRYVSKPCTKSCVNQASAMYHNLYHKNCINHAPTPVPNLNHKPCISTMYINTCTVYQTMHQSCKSTCTIPCTSTIYINMHQLKHVPYHVPIPYHASMMYLTMHKCHQGIPHTYTKNVYQTMCPISNMLLKPCASTIYHITHNISQSFHTPCTIRYH